MLNVFNFMIGTGAFNSISDGMLNYMPTGKFQEVFDIASADIVLMDASIHQNGDFFVSVPKPQRIGFTFGSIEEDFALYGELMKKNRVIWVDVLGPQIHNEPNLLSPDKTGLKETDVILSAVPIGDRPNTWANVWHIEKSMFRPRGRFERVKGSVAVCVDNFDPHFFQNSDIDMVEMILGITDIVSNFYVTNSQSLGAESEAVLGDAVSKITCLNLDYPRGVAYQLAQSEFVLTTRETVGIELMGIEGGLAGCQPIYPGTEFYREAFDGTGVAFYDIEDRAASLRKIIEAGSQFDQETTDAFRQKFSAEETLPAFWEAVYDLYNG